MYSQRRQTNFSEPQILCPPRGDAPCVALTRGMVLPLTDFVSPYMVDGPPGGGPAALYGAQAAAPYGYGAQGGLYGNPGNPGYGRGPASFARSGALYGAGYGGGPGSFGPGQWQHVGYVTQHNHHTPPLAAATAAITTGPRSMNLYARPWRRRRVEFQVYDAISDVYVSIGSNMPELFSGDTVIVPGYGNYVVHISDDGNY